MPVAMHGHSNVSKPGEFASPESFAEALKMSKYFKVNLDIGRIYNDPHRNVEAERDVGARRVDLDVLLADSDFVSVHANLTDGTRGLFDAAHFKKG